MSDDATSDQLLTGALLAGAGVVGYFGARWLLSPHAPATRPTTAPPPRESSTPLAPVQHATASAPAAAPSSSALPRTFDEVFNRHRGQIPIEYLRALAMRESGMKPREHAGPGWGLFQITEPVRADFNRVHGTQVTRAQLLDPDTNGRIATWLLRFIADSYAKNHGATTNLRADWSNRRFVELLTFGWNAGPSEAGGVGRVVGYLERKGATDIDLDLVHAHARAAGAHAHLSNPRKVEWSRGVAALYTRERAASSGPITSPIA